ncbi:MAG: response regulator [Deltaproteobacteria bacterium]|nr:response regulator [Deltaproteobacteria bacterium]
MRILIVDDNQIVASVIQSILELESHEVRLALNGPDGYIAYIQFRPDLVITDIQMPGENGFELINHIRKLDPSVKAIYMSGNLNQFYPLLLEEKRRFPIDFLDKPFTLGELIDRVSELTG